jgi:thiosulfate/3-mercaptopyruvate sulfurtransferase
VLSVPFNTLPRSRDGDEPNASAPFILVVEPSIHKSLDPLHMHMPPRPLITLVSLAITQLASAQIAPPPTAAPPVVPAVVQPAQVAQEQKLGTFEIISISRARSLVTERRVHPLDTRPVARYLAGHLPGAVHIEDELLRQPTSGLPVQFLTAGELAKIFERSGVDAARPVLVYSDGEDPLAATITAYALLKAGHPRVLLLDGGFEAWRGVADVTQEYGAYATTPWSMAAPTAPVAASLDDVRRMVDTDEGVLVDARPAKLFRGEGRHWPRNGHIPGAVNVDWKSMMRSDNEALFKPRKEIEALLREAGLDPNFPTIVYCGTGREATLLYLYLKGVLQWPRVMLYEGSWTEWSADPSLPAGIGDDPYIPVYGDGDVLVSGQPSEALFRELADQGVTMVINCRTPLEMGSVPFSQGSLLRTLGVKLVDIPLGGNEGFEPQDVEALKQTLAHRNGGKVLIHCAGGGRAKELWLAHLIVNEGLSVEAAQERARAAGMTRRSGLERLIDRDTVLQSKP